MAYNLGTMKLENGHMYFNKDLFTLEINLAKVRIINSFNCSKFIFEFVNVIMWI